MMGRSIVFLFALIYCLSGIVTAQDVDVFGYFESQINAQTIRDKAWIMQSNKLRLDLQKRLSDRVLFGANANFLIYHGATDFNALDLIPVAKPYPLLPDSLFKFVYEDTIYIDNAYMQLNLDMADVTIGKQQLSFGTGYAWNPTDIFNSKSLIDPTYEQTGHNAVRIDVPLGTKASVTGIWATGKDFSTSDYYGRLKFLLGHFEFAGIAGGKEIESEFVPRRIKIYGGDVVGELIGLGVWAEGVWRDEGWSQLTDHVELVTGADYTFSFQTYVLGEFYYSDRFIQGWKNTRYSFYEWLYLMTGDIKNMAHRYGFLYVEHPATDLINVGFSAIGNFDDNSVMFNPQMTWYPFQDVEITAIASLGIGAGDTEYGAFDPSGFVRARMSF